MTQNTALLVIDVQMDMFREANPVAMGPQLLETLKSLIARARQAGAPVIYVQHSGRPGFLEEGTSGWNIHPAVAPELGDIVIHKKSPCSFRGTNLGAELDSRGITNVVITGIQSEMCVDTTTRSAFNFGYKAVLVEDGHSTFNTPDLSAGAISRHHNRVLGRQFARVMKSYEVTFQ